MYEATGQFDFYNFILVIIRPGSGPVPISQALRDSIPCVATGKSLYPPKKINIGPLENILAGPSLTELMYLDQLDNLTLLILYYPDQSCVVVKAFRVIILTLAAPCQFG